MGVFAGERVKIKKGSLKKKRIAVLMGGISREREISLRSGDAVLCALLDLGYSAFGLDAGRDLAEKVGGAAEVAFIALHGRYGEDGCVQGLLEVMGIPYTGSGVMASATAMDKEATKVVLGSRGILVPPYLVARKEEANPAGLGLPLVVKPAAQGSTIGVSVVRKIDEFKGALRKALRYGSRAIVESFIEGRELTVGIIDGMALPVIEIRPKGGFYDYKAKYTKGRTEFMVPAELDKGVNRRVVEAAVGAYEALGCRGAARVDLILGKDGKPYVLEVNTSPGMTETSLLPMAARSAGLSYKALVEEIVLGAGLDRS